MRAGAGVTDPSGGGPGDRKIEADSDASDEGDHGDMGCWVLKTIPPTGARHGSATAASLECGGGFVVTGLRGAVEA